MLIEISQTLWLPVIYAGVPPPHLLEDLTLCYNHIFASFCLFIF